MFEKLEGIISKCEERRESLIVEVRKRIYFAHCESGVIPHGFI